MKGQSSKSLPGVFSTRPAPAAVIPRPAPSGAPPKPAVQSIAKPVPPEAPRRAATPPQPIAEPIPRPTPLSPPVVSPVPGSVDVSVILGTVNRPEMVRHCIEAIRNGIGQLSYEIVVAYGRESDPALPWLRQQRDVVLVLGGMEGAIEAFNRAYVASKGLLVCQINDDVMVDQNSILRAVAYLHAEPECAAVVFRFDRGDGQGYRHEKLGKSGLHPNQMVARRSTCEAVISKIGAFWGDKAHRTDKTYGGDSAFGVLCLHLGLRLDSVPGVTCRDREADDALREQNRVGVSTEHGKRWRAMFGPLLESCAAPPAPDRERPARIHATDPTEGQFPAWMKPQRERVLHLHLATPDDPQTGLCRALSSLGDYLQIDWQGAQSRGSLERDVLDAANRLRPTLVFMQLQTPDVVSPALAARLRRLLAPKGVIATWCGDVANKNSPWVTDWQVPLGRAIDLVLHTSLTHVKALRAAGIPGAAYLQIGYDPTQYQPAPISWPTTKDGSDPAPFKVEQTAVAKKDYDVCFLGNRYYSADYLKTMKQHDAGLRDAVIEALSKALKRRFALYGSGHAGGLGQIPLSQAHEAYQRSKIGLNISLCNFLEAYSSDRIFRILGCGALLLTKRFPLMSTYGLRHGENCLIWDVPAEAVQLAHQYAHPNHDKKRAAIAAAGAELARKRHTWEYRMGELAALLRAARGQ